MERVFKTLVGSNPVDLVPYLKEYIAKHPETEILIGCDSQNQKRDTIYAIVVGLNRPGKGAHVIYWRFEVPRVRIEENSVRLLNEVWFSVEVAELIKSQIGIKPKWIDIDLNPDPKWGSNKTLTAAVGIVTGMGYNVRHKGNNPMMTYAGDKLVKPRSRKKKTLA